jgi:hypothetical protein
MLSYDFGLRYLILFVGSLVLLRGVFFRLSPNRDAVFSFFLFANVIFFVTYLLHSVELSMGFAFGLFAVFAMLRYRTEPISVRDMTYLLITIAISLVCAIAKLQYWELAALLALISVISLLGETRLLAPRVVEKKVVYDKVELIKPELYSNLLQDLQARTGLDIVKVEVGKIDYLNDSALLTVYCREAR